MKKNIHTKNVNIAIFAKQNLLLINLIKKYNNYRKIRDHDHYTGKFRGAAHNKCNLDYSVSNEIPVVFYNGSNYDYHFIIRELAKNMDGDMDCLGENTEKNITFKVLIRKEYKGVQTTFKIKFIDSFRFMNRSLSNITDN